MGRWRYVTRKHFDDITAAASRFLATLDTGIDFNALPTSAQAFLAEVHHLASDPETRQAVLTLLRKSDR